MNKLTVSIAVLAVLGFAFGRTVLRPALQYEGHEKEFLCEDDGKLVERHIDVLEAYTIGNEGGSMWRIRYMDGAQAYYHQPEGESCFVEVVK